MKLAALLLATLLVAAGCARDGDDDARATTGAAPSSSEAPTTAPTTTVPPLGCPEPVDGRPADAGPYAVGRQVANYIDPARDTEPSPASGRAPTTGRVLPVAVLYPALGTPGVAVTDGAEPAAASSHAPSR